MSTSGIFITFEGIDGAGKSTHIAGLADAFKAQGRAVTVTREPGGTPLAEKLRTLILNDPMDAMTEALLVFAARRDHLQQVIEPALGRNDVVLCDRFTDATFAYQGGGRGFDFEILTYLEQLIQTSRGMDGYFVRHPDLTVWFDLAPEVAAVRLAGARVPDKFEAQPVSFFAQVRAGYQARCDGHKARFACIDADRSRDAVWQDVHAAIRSRGWLA
jgi:dTMP kinase